VANVETGIVLGRSISYRSYFILPIKQSWVYVCLSNGLGRIPA